jgi:hypothetical protein
MELQAQHKKAERYPHSGWWAWAIVVLLAGYFGGYFFTSQLTWSPLAGPRFRRFEYVWLTTIYQPIGWVEAKYTRRLVVFFTPLDSDADNRDTFEERARFEP